MTERLSGIRIALLAVVIVSSCANKEPTFQEGPDAELSYDGLVRIDNTSFQRVWADPDTDLSGYTKILPMKATIDFRAVKTSAGSSRNYSSKSEFPINDHNREKIVTTVGEVLREEVSENTRFAFTDEPAQDTLILTVSLLDIVSRVPPERASRSEIYISRAGEITIVLELRDSLSGETLLRAAERGAVQRPGNQGMRANSVMGWSELRRLARRWGVKIRDGLDSL